jgi:hypothetical protein
MLTADTITDEQIRELRDSLTPTADFDSFDWQRRRECLIALHDQPYAADSPTSERRAIARARCAEILNARGKATP